MNPRALILAMFCGAAFFASSNAQATQTGSVFGWGNQLMPVVQPGTHFTQVAAGTHHSLALKSDGTVVAWGFNYSGQCTVPSGLSGVIAIAAGNSHSLALKSDGTVVAWSDNGWSQSTVPSGLNGVIAIAAGEAHNLALKSDGTVVAWGWNGRGQSTEIGRAHV